MVAFPAHLSLRPISPWGPDVWDEWKEARAARRGKALLACETPEYLFLLHLGYENSFEIARLYA
jgi:hypothetical protein